MCIITLRWLTLDGFVNHENVEVTESVSTRIYF